MTKQFVSMRKSIFYFCLFLPIHLIACNGESNNHANHDITADMQVQKDSIPVLLAGSFLNNATSLSLDSLKKGIKAGRITCTADLTEDLVQRFALTSSPKIQSVNQFDFKSSTALLLTTIDSIDNRFLSLSIDSIDYFLEPNKYPLFFQSNHAFNSAKDLTRFLHTGVTAITRSTGTVLDREGIDFYLKNIQPYFTGNDYTHVSNEVSMQAGCSYPAMKMKFATKPEHFEILKRLNVNVVELTGNHNLDVGTEAYVKTMDWYDQQGMQHFGGGLDPSLANKPLVITLRDNHKVAWVGFNELCPCGECADRTMGANRYSKEKAANIIDSLRKKVGVSYITVCVQFGEVTSYLPTTSQKAKCKELIDLGADVVIGSQAHQVQEIVHYRGKPIFYGLGNFLFDQIHSAGVRQAYFMRAYFYKGRIVQYKPVYTFMGLNRQPNIATKEERETIRKAILKPENF